MSEVLTRSGFEAAWENKNPLQYRPIVEWKNWTSPHKPAFDTSVEFRINPERQLDDDFEYLDSDGYPTDQLLNSIETWKDSYLDLLLMIEPYWWGSASGSFKIARSEDNESSCIITVATCGWSGNEDIIYALKMNKLFWIKCWIQSNRGGKYIFEIKGNPS